MPLPGWIAGLLVPGTMVREAVFFHRASRTVILADLIENFEPARVRSRLFRWLVRLAGVAHPRGGTPADMRLTFWPRRRAVRARSEEHTSELQSLMRNSYAVFCLKKKKNKLTCY